MHPVSTMDHTGSPVEELDLKERDGPTMWGNRDKLREISCLSQ